MQHIILIPYFIQINLYLTDDFYWTDENNQRTKYAQKLQAENNPMNGTLSGIKSNFDGQSSTSGSSDIIENEELVSLGRPEENPAIINIEHKERNSDLTVGCEKECDVTKVNIRASPRSIGSSRDSQNKSIKNKPVASSSAAVKL